MFPSLHTRGEVSEWMEGITKVVEGRHLNSKLLPYLWMLYYGVPQEKQNQSLIHQSIRLNNKPHSKVALASLQNTLLDLEEVPAGRNLLLGYDREPVPIVDKMRKDCCVLKEPSDCCS